MMLRVISLGAGVQSTTMALMAAYGEIGPMPDCAIFADRQGEPQAVYDHLRWLMSPNVLPFPVHIVTRGNLWKEVTTIRTTRDGERTYTGVALPVYTKFEDEAGMGLRHCTRNFKIDPINSEIRRLLGLKRVPHKSGPLVTVMIGISLDEAMRKKPSPKPWIIHRWPLLENNMTRKGCLEWLEGNGYPVPPRSACTFCPYKSDREWLSLTPDEFADSVEKEKQLQEAYGAATALRTKPYFHRSRIPLSEVVFNPAEPSEKAHQIDMFNNECEGMCGV